MAFSERRPSASKKQLLIAFGAYFVLSFVLWVHLWTDGVTAHSICGCGDPALTLWFLEWPAHALAHGASPLFSPAAFHPTGLNMLSNTGMLAIGIPLVPVSWIFGPVASFNVALTLTPALSSLAAFWLASRWVRSKSAAFVCGLLYGFSSFALANLVGGHLNMALLAVVPVLFGLLEELFLSQRHPSARTGVLLAIALVVQFFISTEILLVVGVACVVGLLILAVYGFARDRGGLLLHLRRARNGVAVGSALTALLLAYPTWYALAGPAHLRGKIWPTIGRFDTYGVSAIASPHASASWDSTLKLWGYGGSGVPSELYLGYGILAVVGAGLLVFRRDRRLWFLAILGGSCAWTSLSTTGALGTPWRAVSGVPLLEDVIQSRFFVVTVLCTSLAVAVVVDHVETALSARRSSDSSGTSGTSGVSSALGVLGVSAVALVPLLAVDVPSAPFTVQRVDVPAWFTSATRDLAPGRVVLAYPPPFSGVQSAMAWQAVARMAYVQVGGSGPQALPERAGAERPGLLVLDSLSFAAASAPAGTSSELSNTRRALKGWGVTTVVVPPQVGPPLFGQGRDAAYAAGFFTAVLGRAPSIDDGSLVWEDVSSSPPPLRIPAGTLESCWAQNRSRPEPDPSVTTCVTSAASAVAQTEQGSLENHAGVAGGGDPGH
jgi:hypothetical protein